MEALKGARALFASFGIPRDEKILVGLSGGSDSTALFLFLLEEAGPERLAVLHVNHGIRGEEAGRDEAFCRELARKAGVPFVAAYRDVPAEAREKGRSIEEAGREARYALLSEYAARFGCRYAALGHNRGDFAETFFFHLLRGAGLRGLSSIPAVREEGTITVIRPLLTTEREELRRYLRERGQDWVEDSTNSDPAYTRNRIRQKLLPEMRKINPRLNEETVLLAEEFREEEALLTRLADEAFEGVKAEDGLSAEGLLALDRPVRARVVRRYLEESGAPWNREVFRRTESLLSADAAPSARIDLGNGKTLCRRYGILRLAGERPESFDPVRVDLSREGEYSLFPGLRARVDFGPFPGREKAEKDTLYLKTDETEAVLRPRRAGDEFRGTRGTKTLKKLMIDRKIPREERDRIPVAEIGGTVAGVMGEGASRPFRASAPGDPVIRIVFIHETEDI